MNRVKDAIDLSIKRAQWNFKTAIPTDYPRVRKLQLLLPVCLLSDEVDMALAVEKTQSSSYLAKQPLQPFSFSTLAQAVAIGRLGVIYLLDRNDKQIGYIIKGRTARWLRDFALLTVAYGFKLERRVPGSFFLPGRHRVSWRQATEAMQEFQTAHKVSSEPRF
jgi:Domain of unknown function (DUF3825)